MRIRGVAISLIALVFVFGAYVRRASSASFLAIYGAAAPTATATPTSTPTPGSVETAYYLSGIGQTSYPSYALKISGTYGQVNLAARLGWRWLQPTKDGVYNWSALDTMQKLAHDAGAKWSLSITPGAYTPLWMFYPTGHGSYPCTASPTGIPGPTEDGPQPPGSAPVGALKAFQFNWQSGFVYTNGSTQCLPPPWDTAYQTAFQSMINAVSTHDGNGYGYGIKDDPSLDHIVITGVNGTTQETFLPACTTQSSTCGINSGTGPADVTQWETDVVADGGTCTGNSLSLCPGWDNSTPSDYTTRIQTAWNTMAGYWTTAFPTKKIAFMFTDSPSFPFNSYPSVTLQKMIQHMIANNPSNSYVMNNSVSGTSPYLANKLTCYTIGNTGCLPPPAGFTQPSHAIAGQEGQAITSGSPSSCSNTAAFANMMTAALSDESAFMEIYDQDVKCLP